jgi:AcrR family transcriptional regulator
VARSGTRGVPRAEREAAMLAAAGAVFAANGYHAASMDEIAERAGITKPMIYTYFGSKEGLYVAYIEAAGQELLERMRASAPEDAEPVQRLRAGALEFLTFVGERREGWQVLYAEAAARGGPLAGEIADLRSRIAAIVAAAVARPAGADRADPAHDPALDAFAHAFVGAGESLANWWLEHPEVPVETVAEQMVALGQAGVTSLTRRRD